MYKIFIALLEKSKTASEPTSTVLEMVCVIKEGEGPGQLFQLYG